MTASWLVGVFVFAILIGDIRDIVLNARKGELRFQKQLDNVAAYMSRLVKLSPQSWITSSNIIDMSEFAKQSTSTPIW